ncbi:hypothetical protein DYP60_04350 [Sphaerochaeta halotolerans]|uniref:Uncharacterized protein n=1 Tax=Sphaerochaeta halotolerans TaxID=2293840 RepID=A0A372MIV9_9SPIR|nr:hypothetical protein DYP60_04350 [Sphaerochaeta halotolerans]
MCGSPIGGILLEGGERIVVVVQGFHHSHQFVAASALLMQLEEHGDALAGSATGVTMETNTMQLDTSIVPVGTSLK